MATPEIKLVKRSPSTREEERDKAAFDSSMVHVRDVVKAAGYDAAEYFHRQLIAECRSLERKFGFARR